MAEELRRATVEPNPGVDPESYREGPESEPRAPDETYGDSISPVPWRVRDAAFATVAVGASLLVLVVSLRYLADIVDLEDSGSLAPWLLGLTEGLMLAAVWLFAVKKRGATWHMLGLRVSRARRRLVLPWVVLVASLVFTSVYAVLVAGLGLDVLRPEPIPEDLLGDGVDRVLNAMVIVLWGPFAEELFFRGFILAALIAPLGPLRAAVLSSAVFAGAHVSLSAMVPIFVTGMLLSWLYLRTRSIWQPITAHAAQNLIVLSLAI